MPINDDERVARLQKGWKYAYEAKTQAAKGTIGPYDEEDRPGSEVVAPLTKDTQDRMRAQGQAATAKVKGSMASGGTIPETGLYKMHAGEKVIPAGGGGSSMGHGTHTGAAEKLPHSGGERQNSPFRQLHEGGHALNHSFKNPVASVMGNNGVNQSYMHPLDHGNGPAPENSPKPFALGKQIKPMNQQGAGKTGPVQIR